MIFKTTTTLSVSQKEPLDCKKMAEFLGAKGFYTSVTTNITTEPHMEYGCRLTQTMTQKKELESLWTVLKNKYNFTCAHLRVGDQFEGCILDFLRPSLCSSKIHNNAFNALAPEYGGRLGEQMHIMVREVYKKYLTNISRSND